MKSVYLVIAHGSRERQSNDAFFDLVGEFQRAYPHRKVQPAFLELGQPNIPQAIEESIRAGASEIFVIPMMLFPGRHVKEDIPRFIEAARAKHLDIDFHYSGPLSEDLPSMTRLLAGKVKFIRKHLRSRKRNRK